MRHISYTFIIWASVASAIETGIYWRILFVQTFSLIYFILFTFSCCCCCLIMKWTYFMSSTVSVVFPRTDFSTPQKRLSNKTVNASVYVKIQVSGGDISLPPLRKYVTADLTSWMVFTEECLGSSNVDRNSSLSKYCVLCCAYIYSMLSNIVQRAASYSMLGEFFL